MDPIDVRYVRDFYQSANTGEVFCARQAFLLTLDSTATQVVFTPKPGEVFESAVLEGPVIFIQTTKRFVLEEHDAAFKPILSLLKPPILPAGARGEFGYIRYKVAGNIGQWKDFIDSYHDHGRISSNVTFQIYEIGAIEGKSYRCQVGANGEIASIKGIPPWGRGDSVGNDDYRALQNIWPISFGLDGLLAAIVGANFYAVITDAFWSTFFGIALTVLLCIRFGWKRSTIVSWTVASIAFGPYTPLLILALNSLPAQELCANCGKRRVATNDLCERCGAAWPQAVLTGAEIFEPGTVQNGQEALVER